VISWLGNLEESPSNPKRYDAYHNTVDGCSYIYDGANWTLLASKGDKGETGSSGADGRSIVWKGTFYSHPENPQELWTYYNATDGNAYIYSNGSWSLLMQNLAVNYDTPTIIGTVSSYGDMYSVSDVYIKVVDESSSNTVWNSLPAADGDFAVSGLDASKTYTLHFSSRRLSDVNITNSKALAATEDVSFGAVRTNVSPLGGKAQNLGSIVLSPQRNGTWFGRPWRRFQDKRRRRCLPRWNPICIKDGLERRVHNQGCTPGFIFHSVQKGRIHHSDKGPGCILIRFF